MKHILICHKVVPETQYASEYEYIQNNFFGDVIYDIDDIPSDVIMYVCGDVANNFDQFQNTIFVIKELSTNYLTDSTHYQIMTTGAVPINICHAGVYFRNLFSFTDTNFFETISHDHQFQSLTESNKTSNAFRKGIYLSKVEKIENDLHFNLLRCSSNLDGPTENFRIVDHVILYKTNEVAKRCFDNCADLNHVLAQIYYNKIEVVGNRNTEKKAKISAHSDKTKDMPSNGLIAFCTFYENFTKDPKFKQIKKSESNIFDYCYNDTSVFTNLYFKLKNTVTDTSLVPEFNVVLYPNSVFIISLETNRLYTHEIRPSILPIDKIPTRMGYVMRCSKTIGVFKDGQTYINDVKLEGPDSVGVAKLKKLYLEENITHNQINYGNIYFSLNEGDYLQPTL